MKKENFTSNPAQGPDKARIRQMFNGIASSYDTMNHLLSAGFDVVWRRKAARSLKRQVQPGSECRILDVATGTGDLLFQLARNLEASYVGVDIAENMLAIARQKASQQTETKSVRFEQGDAENLNFPDHHFDAVSCAFGVRNFQHLMPALHEFYRVMKKGGSLLIIEFCWKNNHLLTFFMRLLIRSIGRFSDKESYRYLPDSVEGFYTQKEFLAMLRSCGFQELHSSTLFMGVAAIYTARKNE